MSETDKTMEGIKKRLADPFPASDIEWRVQSSGDTSGKIWARVLAYVTARAIQDRLDEVCGIFGWKNIYDKGPDGGVMCGIAIADAEGIFITKWDGAENTNIEAVKGGISSAFKRAGSVWGIGRYLYDLEATFATINDKGRYSSQTKEKKWFKWNPPTLPIWALPEGDTGESSAPQPPELEPAITVEVILAKIAEAKAMLHLKNIWDKYKPDIAKYNPQVQAQLAAAKNARKDEIANAARAALTPDPEAAAIAADEARGDGQESMLDENHGGDPS